MGGPMRCGTGAVPAGGSSRGRIVDPAAVGFALKQLLARCEVTETRALVAAGDAVATFRVFELPGNTVDSDVAATVAKELPLDPDRIAVRWFDVQGATDQRVIYAAAWDRALVKNVVDATRAAGLEPVVVDLKSAALARAVGEPSCVVVDLSSDPVDMVLVDGHMPRVWHAFEPKTPIGPDVASSLAAPLRSMLRFYRRRGSGSFGGRYPILIGGEHMLPHETLAKVAELVGQPVVPMPAPARVDPSVRHGTFLACLGLMMRRT